MLFDSNIISKVISELDKSFLSNELSYLALTSKIENPIRDRLAYELYKQCANKYIISREYKRSDIAIHSTKSLSAIIELTAIYSFDAIKENKCYEKKMIRDIEKSKKIASTETNLYTILLATHPHGKCDQSNKAIKYVPGINKAISKLGSSIHVKKECIKRVEKTLSERNIICSGELIGGESYSIEMSILYWLIKW